MLVPATPPALPAPAARRARPCLRRPCSCRPCRRTGHAAGASYDARFERTEIGCRAGERKADVRSLVDEIAIGRETHEVDVRQAPVRLTRCRRLALHHAHEVGGRTVTPVMVHELNVCVPPTICVMVPPPSSAMLFWTMWSDVVSVSML